jgi:hypothetical protein
LAVAAFKEECTHRTRLSRRRCRLGGRPAFAGSFVSRSAKATMPASCLSRLSRTDWIGASLGNVRAERSSPETSAETARKIQPVGLGVIQVVGVEQGYRVQEGDNFGFFKDRSVGGFPNQPRQPGAKTRALSSYMARKRQLLLASSLPLPILRWPENSANGSRGAGCVLDRVNRQRGIRR